jgi:aryl-alcohol dehydrogenase-like predicted oxidoreductase
LVEYEQLSAELGREPAEVALAWLLHQPAVTSPIIGPRNQEQLRSAVRATSLTLDYESLSRLANIFPGHQPAPEDYAW